MKIKLLLVLSWFLDRLGESTTWQAIGFIVSLFGSHFAGVSWGDGAALGGLISAAIKAVTKG
jgi:hypothetical protein